MHDAACGCWQCSRELSCSGWRRVLGVFFARSSASAVSSMGVQAARVLADAAWRRMWVGPLRWQAGRRSKTSPARQFWRTVSRMVRSAAARRRVGGTGWLVPAACGLVCAISGCGAFERSARAEASHGRGPAAVEAPPASAEVAPPAGTAGARTGCSAAAGPIDAAVTQLVVVTSPSFAAWQAQLQRYTRSPAGAWQSVGEPSAVVLGRAGYAWGDGLHGTGAPLGYAGPVKREGDGRSPAGVFALGDVHGYAAQAPTGMTLPYAQASAALRCVDDPRAAQYNRILEAGPRGDTWRSAERMRRDDAVYELALDIEHNRSPVVPGHGSCIFAHVWVSPQTPVAGCTGMALPELRSLLLWLKPGALWVGLPVQEYRALRACWDLP